ncbi:hypothetical protein [Bacillus pseudomycoides]|uniref:hypothetical protein n=1 Tax=Bacillus pseudomycoides TaxID=64104 RepID=UPI000BEDB829|nr:hypothetical protein [Bacillus pseudomycoides]PEB42234.1 hypothetical protein COO06_07945 [Bacillus pseudomycoides]PGA62193.1 hypothetical protein COL84_13545 [Bacillus pseudomycoides]
MEVYKIYSQYNEGIDKGAIYVSCKHDENTVANLLQFLDEKVVQHENDKVKSAFLDEKPLRNILCNYYGFTVMNPANYKEYKEIELEGNRHRQDLIVDIDSYDWFCIEGIDKIIESEILEQQEVQERFIGKIIPVMEIKYGDKHLVEQSLDDFSLNELKMMKNYLYITGNRLQSCLEAKLTDKWNVKPDNFFQKAYSNTTYCKHCNKVVPVEDMDSEDMCIPCYCQQRDMGKEEEK